MYYSDTGQWKEPENGSFGMQLIAIFVEQLEGEMERTCDDKGTHYLFDFKCLDTVVS